MTHKLKFIIVTLLLVLTFSENLNLRLFLTEQQTWLFFPHHQNALYTYTASCQPTTLNHLLQHPQFQTISTLLVNNLCLSIDILDDSEEVTSRFYYAKLSPKGVCTVYEVEESKIRIYYEYSTGKRFDNVLMLNRLTTILWNQREIMQIDYCLFSKKVNVYEFTFNQQGNHRCREGSTYSVVCWSEKEILFLNLSRLSSNVTLPIYEQQIAMILPLVAEEGVYFICEKIICNISRVSDSQIQTLYTYPFVMRILGGSVFPETNSFIMVSHDSIEIYTYFQFGLLQLKLQQSITLPAQFQCVNYDHSLFIGEMIIVQCFNFMGQEQKLVLLKDSQINKYVAYNPLSTLNADCWLSGNYYYFFAVCGDSITTMDTNFYYLQIKGNFGENEQSFNVQLECSNDQSLQTRLMQYYNINVTNSILGNVYINALMSPYYQISYNLYVPMRLNSFFKASNIIRYKVESDCRFIKPIAYESIHYSQYFSIYNREKCVQIVSGGGQLFYRLIQVNETVFYLEECLPLKYGYGCQLNEIYENERQVRLGIHQFRLIRFYLFNHHLKMRFGGITRKIFDGEVQKLEVTSEIIRVKTKESYYFNTIDNIINNCGEWISEQFDRRYAYHDSAVLQLSSDGTIREYRNGRVVREMSSPLLAFEPQNRRDENDSILLPCFFKKGYYIFVVSQSYITKVYAREKVIAYYRLPFNPQNYTISDIKMTDIYLTVEYEIGQFQIYDIGQEMLSAKIATIQESIMTDIILLDRDVILIPIKSETSLIKIQRDPFISIGVFAPEYSRFQELCNFTLEPIIENGSCPSSINNPISASLYQDSLPFTIFQSFSMKIKYEIMQIDLGSDVGIESVPDQCQNCVIELREEKYLGPIFGYQLNDDYFESFTLIPHLNISECIDSQTEMLNGLFEVRLEGDFTSSEAMMTDGKNIYIIDASLDVTSTYQMKDTQFCSSFIYIGESYLILCDKYFLLVRKGQPILSNAHNLTISSITRNTIQLLFEKTNADTYTIYLLDHDINVYIYQLNIKTSGIKHIQTYNFARAIEDMKVVNDKIIILKHSHLCLAQSAYSSFRETDAVRDCFNLSNIIPYEYSLSYSYDQILPYYSSPNKVKVLIIGKNVDSLHIDLQIEFTGNQTKFTIINAYAGYEGFVFKQLISLNITGDTYSNFIILYESTSKNKNSQIIAYYRYNQGYRVNKTIGHIRSAQFLENYFKLPFNFSFASFPQQMFITHHTVPADTSNDVYPKNKQCLSVQVRDQLMISLNYEQAPPVKFIILKARNLNSINSRYIRVNFIPTTNTLVYSGIGVGVFVILFILLVIITNRCKTKESDIEVHFMKEEIEEDLQREQDVESVGASSLLHSKESSEQPTSEEEHEQRQYHKLVGKRQN